MAVKKSKAQRAALATSDLGAQVLGGERAALAKAITLLESTAERDGSAQRALLQTLLPNSGKAIRIGVTGVPGAGKSTLIDMLGAEFIKRGKTVAVLAIDPSSSVSGGSILGDKTRMERLSRDPKAFIRPSPTSGILGGVALHTREAVVAVEAAGYDVVLIETVGVGQSEVAIRSLVDCCLLLLLTGGGDELQTMKRGLMELADILVVSKADGANEQIAERCSLDVQQVLPFLRSFAPGWKVPVLRSSGVSGYGVPELVDAIASYQAHAMASGHFEALRTSQRDEWFEERLTFELRRRLLAGNATRYHEIKASVHAGAISVVDAVESVLSES